MSKLVAVFGAGGSRGATIAAAVQRRGYRVRAIARTEASVRRFLSPFLGERVEFFPANLESPNTLAPALQGVDSIILLLPVGNRAISRPDATRWVLSVARRAGVSEIISVLGGYAGLRYLPVTSTAPMTALGDLVLESGIPAVVLAPTIYLENLRAPGYQPGLHEDGVLTFPPLGPDRRFSLTTFRDQAVLTAAALDRPDLRGELHQIASPPAVTGPELATLLSPWFERAVTYQPLTPAAYGATVAAASHQPAAGEAAARMWAEFSALRPDALVVDTDALAARFQVTLLPLAAQLATWRPRTQPAPPPPAGTATGDADGDDADGEFAPLASDARLT